MNIRSKSTLFLIEQLIVVAVFAISAAACITILASAYFTSVETRELRNALLVAENVAETFKATNGSADTIATILGCERTITTRSQNNNLVTTIYYDYDWQITYLSLAYYKLELTQPVTTPGTSFDVISGELVVSTLSGDEILSFPVAARALLVGGEQHE